MAVNTYCPRFALLVYKTRQRADAGQPSRMEGGQVWDITHWLGDGSIVSVSKSVHQPMGSFVIQIPDVAFAVSPESGGSADTLYGLLEPLDEIEIRLARATGYGADAQQLPILFRGFIREIRRSEVMSPDGKPNRIVVIQGNDYGLLFNLTQIPPSTFWTAMGQSGFIAGLLTYQLLHLDNKPYPVGEMLQSILTHLVQPQLTTMMARFSDIPLWQTPSPVQGKIAPPGIDTLTGPIWNFMARIADTPWNELFVDDAESGPVLRLRVCPWHDLNGQSIPQVGGQTATADAVDIDIRDVIQLDAARNDANVANIYWVKGGGFEQLLGLYNQVFNAAQTAQSLAWTFLNGTDAPNSDPDLYGYRYMELDTALLPNDITDELRGVKKDDQKKNEQVYLNWAEERRKGLILLNQDNVAFEHGRMTLKGNEAIKAGKWVRLSRESFFAEYYAASVTHEFAPYRHYTTKVDFVRGTGFIERMKSDGSPHLKEGKRGVYSSI